MKVDSFGGSLSARDVFLAALGSLVAGVLCLGVSTLLPWHTQFSPLVAFAVAFNVSYVEMRRQQAMP